MKPIAARTPATRATSSRIDAERAGQSPVVARPGPAAPFPHRFDSYAIAGEAAPAGAPIQRIDITTAVPGQIYRVSLPPIAGIMHLRFHELGQLVDEQGALVAGGVFTDRAGQSTLPILGAMVNHENNQNASVDSLISPGTATGEELDFGYEIGEQALPQTELTLSQDDDGIWLEYIQVSPAHQRHGIAAAMMRRAVAEHGVILASNQSKQIHEDNGDDGTRWLTDDGAAFVNAMIGKGLMQYCNPFA